MIRRAGILAREEQIYLQLGLIVQLRTAHYPFAENRTILIDPSGARSYRNYFKAIHPLGDADFPALARRAGQARPELQIPVSPCASGD